jgi:hypothetical protein
MGKPRAFGDTKAPRREEQSRLETIRQKAASVPRVQHPFAAELSWLQSLDEHSVQLLECFARSGDEVFIQAIIARHRHGLLGGRMKDKGEWWAFDADALRFRMAERSMKEPMLGFPISTTEAQAYDRIAAVTGMQVKARSAGSSFEDAARKRLKVVKTKDSTPPPLEELLSAPLQVLSQLAKLKAECDEADAEFETAKRTL